MPEQVPVQGDDSRAESEGFDELLRRAQAGNRQAMDRVLAILRPYLVSLAHRYADPSHPNESTSDLLQESCLRAWRKLETFQGGENDEETFSMFRSWIGQIVKRVGLNAWRDERRQRRSPPEKIVPLGTTVPTGSGRSPRKAEALARERTPSSYAREEEVALQVRTALEQLPDPTCARIIRMRFFEGLTIWQIADRLGMSYDDVRNRYRATSEKLQRKLGHLA